MRREGRCYRRAMTAGAGRCLTVGLALVCLALFAGCQTKARRPLRIGLTQFPPYDMAFLARDLGYLSGVSVELVDMRSPAEVRRAYKNGLLDGVAVTMESVIEFSVWDRDDRVVQVIDVSDGADALIARRSIESIADLRGKRLALENTPLGHLVARRALSSAGVEPDEVTLVPLDFPNHATSFANGSVDAVVTWEPMRSRSLAAGGHVLFSSADMPNEIVDVLVVQGPLVDARLNDLRGLADGWFRAVEYFEKHPQDAAKRIAPRQGLSPAQVLDAFDGLRLVGRHENIELLDGERPRLLKALQETARYLGEIGLMRSAAHLDGMVSSRVVAP